MSERELLQEWLNAAPMPNDTSAAMYDLMERTSSYLSRQPIDAAPDSATLEKDIERTINRHSAENASNTPDYILAQYLIACLSAFNVATQQRETWYGRDPRPTEPFAAATRDAKPRGSAPDGNGLNEPGMPAPSAAPDEIVGPFDTAEGLIESLKLPDMVMVPREPTNEMLGAGMWAWLEREHAEDHTAYARHKALWKAMLAAAEGKK